MIPLEKLQAVVRRTSEIDDLMCDPKVIADSGRMQALSRERSQILPLVDAVREWEGVKQRIVETRDMLADPELGPLAREELGELERQHEELEQKLRVLLLPRDP